MKFGNLLLLGLSFLSVSCTVLSSKDAKLIEASGQIIPNTGVHADNSFPSILKKDFNFVEKNVRGDKYEVELIAYTLCFPLGTKIKEPASLNELSEFEKACSSFILDKSRNSAQLSIGESKIVNFKEARTHFVLEGGVHKPCPKGVGVAFGLSLNKASLDAISLEIHASYVPMVNLALFAPKVMVDDFPKGAISVSNVTYTGLAPSFFVLKHLTRDSEPEDFLVPQSYLNANYNDNKTLLRTLMFVNLKKM